MKRCEARTVRGARCKSESVVYHRHTDGHEYLVCKLHDNQEFRPILKPTLAPPDDPIYSAGFVVGGRRVTRKSS